MSKPSDPRDESWAEAELARAAAELDGHVPVGFFEGFSSRLAATLEGVTMEPTGTNDLPNAFRDDWSGPAMMATPPKLPKTAAAEERDEHSGLHEIKALASSARERISKRRTTENDLEESLLTSSSSGLPAVVLPDPEKSTPQMEMIAASSPSLEMPALAEERPAAAANFGAGLADRGTPKPWLWITLGSVAVVAAATAFLVMGPLNGDRAENGGEVVAANAPAAPPAVRVPAAAAAAPVIQPLEEIAADEDDAPNEGVTKDEPAIEKESANSEPAPAKAEERAAVARERSEKRANEAVSEAKPDTDKTKKVKAEPEVVGGAEAKKPVAEATTGKGDINSILDEVTGGPSKAVVTPEEDAKPDKRKIGSGDVKKAMGRVTGKVNRCGSKTGFTGKVKAKFSVAPSGKVTKASASSSDKKIKRCVEAAVRSARFPSFEPPGISFSYLFLIGD